jgi:hypothetical protein
MVILFPYTIETFYQADIKMDPYLPDLFEAAEKGSKKKRAD